MTMKKLVICNLFIECSTIDIQAIFPRLENLEIVEMDVLRIFGNKFPGPPSQLSELKIIDCLCEKSEDEE